MTSRALVGCVAGLLLVIGACGDKIQPSGSTLIKDAPPPPPPPPPDDARPPEYDAGIPDGADDALYTRADANLGACDGCECHEDTSYCFAGATLRAPMDGGADDGGDSGPLQCTVATSATPAVGCNQLPAACAAKPTCECLIDNLQVLFRCYLNCRNDGAKWLVYCPTP